MGCLECVYSQHMDRSFTVFLIFARFRYSDSTQPNLSYTRGTQKHPQAQCTSIGAIVGCCCCQCGILSPRACVSSPSCRTLQRCRSPCSHTAASMAKTPSALPTHTGMACYSTRLPPGARGTLQQQAPSRTHGQDAGSVYFREVDYTTFGLAFKRSYLK